MEARFIAALILLPVAAIFIYAGIHEYRRFKSKGRANYGLVYDEETGTTHVTEIPEGEDSYDLDEFDPGDYNVGPSRDESDEEREKG